MKRAGNVSWHRPPEPGGNREEGIREDLPRAEPRGERKGSAWAARLGNQGFHEQLQDYTKAALICKVNLRPPQQRCPVPPYPARLRRWFRKTLSYIVEGVWPARAHQGHDSGRTSVRCGRPLVQASSQT